MFNRADLNVSMDCHHTFFDLSPSEHKQTNLFLLISQHRNQWVIEVFFSLHEYRYVVDLSLLILVMNKLSTARFVLSFFCSFMKSSSKLRSVYIYRRLCVYYWQMCIILCSSKKKDNNHKSSVEIRFDLVKAKRISVQIDIINEECTCLIY